jgi:hypothetical protein
MEGKRLTFVEMIAYLNGVAATWRRNSTGDIFVTVIGIDAVKPRRTRKGRTVAAKRPNKSAGRRPRRVKAAKARRR